MKTARATFLGGPAGALLVLLVTMAGCSDPGHLTEARFGSARMDLQVTSPTEPA